MKKKPVAKPRAVTRVAKSGAIVIGRKRFEKISSVEGIVLTHAMKDRIAIFDADGLTPQQRRDSIKRAYRKG